MPVSAFYKTLPSKNPSENLVFPENPYRRLLRTLLRSVLLHDLLGVHPKSEGKKYTPKVFSALKNQVPQQAKNRFGVYQKACLQEKKGTEKENRYTPKRLPGVCAAPLRAALVYRFWAPAKADRNSGHVVQGHVDETGQILEFRRVLASGSHVSVDVDRACRCC